MVRRWLIRQSVDKYGKNINPIKERKYQGDRIEAGHREIQAHQIMNAIKLFFMTLFQLIKQVGSLPETMRKAFKRRHQQAQQKIFEVERLDRIRNPSKYQGK